MIKEDGCSERNIATGCSNTTLRRLKEGERDEQSAGGGWDDSTCKCACICIPGAAVLTVMAVLDGGRTPVVNAQTSAIDATPTHDGSDTAPLSGAVVDAVAAVFEPASV